MNKVNLIPLSTLTRKEVKRFFRIWSQTLLPSAISTILYFVIFGSLVGPRIGEIKGYPYVAYITPGLIMMAVINNSFSNVAASFFSAKFQRNIEEMFVSSMTNMDILLGFVFGGMLRGCVVGVIVVVVALFFTRIPIYHLGVMILVVFGTATLFSLGGFINAIFSQRFDDISIVPTFVLTPLTYLGGVFFSIGMLPNFWEKISYLNPILYMISAFRYGMLGTSDVNVGISLTILFLLDIAAFIVAWRLLSKGIGVKV